MENKIYAGVLMITLLLLSKTTLIAQAPNWQWAQSAHGGYVDKSNSIAVDGNGNSYITGNYASDTITFGSTVLLNPFHQNPQVFIAKYDAAGNSLWAAAAIPGSLGTNNARGIAVDASGNVYITGEYESDSITIGSTVLINTDQVFWTSDIFIAKYDTDGNPLWAKSLAGDNRDESHGIALDPSGNPVITGDFQSSTLTVDTVNLVNTSNGNADFFVAKFDTTGNVTWAKTANSNVHDVVGNSIAMDANGNALIAGHYFGDSLHFDTITLTNGHPLNADFFIVKYDAGGNALWAKNAGGTDNDMGMSITADANDNAYVTGYYNSGSIIFGNDTLNNTIGSGGYREIFIVKFDASGNVVWAKSAGGSGSETPNGIVADAHENVYVAGVFNISPVSYFDTIALSNPGGWLDLFIVKYDSTGSARWAMAGGNAATASTTLSAITLGATGDLYITGDFGCDTLTFGNVTATNPAIGQDIFLAKASTGIFTGIVQPFNAWGAISIYPNPGKGKFNIESDAPVNEIKIATVQGQIIYHASRISAEDRSVVVTLDREGIYFVTVNTNEKVQTKKIIVQH